ncbi:MAG TPA: A/G-specific adenine glycosylase [Thermoanaerobaculia bacterium]|nr:A/G-specific adenine glycosylase [Thermoanaerobaculia bacterium]
MTAGGAPRALLAWYQGARRDLPWRRRRDPYAVWLSEVMLQQTRVRQVVGYWRRFLRRFPTVETLAAASEEEVMALWSGLGYYRRARQLHRAARQLTRDGWPTDAAGLRRLPGVGEYTAAAVASIAFGEAVPVLDGNVARLLARRLALRQPVTRVAARRRLRQAAAELLDRERPGDSNQALMELGATVCTPRRPACAACPLAVGCRAREEGTPEAYPVRAGRRRPSPRAAVAALVAEGSRVLLFRRGEGDALLGGSWEVPWVEAASAVAAGRALAARYGGRWRLGVALGTVRHAITWRQLTVAVRAAERVAEDGGEGVAEGLEAGWFTPSQVLALPRSSLVGKVLALRPPHPVSGRGPARRRRG